MVYSPVLYFNYLFHDDATFWVKLKEYGFKHIYFDTCMSQCRYGDALLLNLENLFVHKVSDLKFLRFLGIVISSCNAYLILQQMRRLSFSDIQAFLVISAMFFLPGFAVINFYGIGSSFLTLCIFLSCWSFHRVETGKGLVIPALSFLFAITIYPPAAMFYWTLTGMYILFVRDRFSVLFKNNIFRFMAVGSTGLLIYAILVFFTHYFFSHKIGSSLYNPYAITPDWPGKLQWFFQEPMGNALNLWNIFPKAATSIIVSGLIASGALVVITRNGVALTCLWQLCLFIFVFFLTFLPNLAAKGNAAFYRCLFPLTSLIWLLLVWAIFKWMDIIPATLSRWGTIALLSVIVVCAGLKTQQNVLYYRVLPSHVEYNAYKLMAGEIRSKKIDAIHILLPYHFSNERYDEFVVLTSHYLFDIYHLIYCALKQTGSPEVSLPLVYISFPGDDVLYKFDEIYFKKLPDGKWVFKVINRDEQFHEYNHSGRNTLDRGLTVLLAPQKAFSKKLNWCVLNINDIFSPPNYNGLIPKINDRFDDNMAIEIAPQFVKAYNDRGNINFKQGNFTEAISDYNKAVGLKADYEDSYYNLGLTYYKQGNLTQALSNYSKAIEINPKDTAAYNDRAIIYYKLREYDKTWDDVHKIKELKAAVDPQLINALKQVTGRIN